MTTKNTAKYKPPYTISPTILRFVEEIGEMLGKLSLLEDARLNPQLRRENRIRTIQASLEIENNTLTLDQVTAVIDGKRVLGLPKEIQEVRNAYKVYESIESRDPLSLPDLLSAHGTMIASLVDDPGSFRNGGVSIFRGNQVVHMAPQADRVAKLMKNLINWLASTDEHPLITSCVFHYELEFIHPFSDGNGRIGRLWQTLILMQWKLLFAYLPVESVVRDRQDDYYKALACSDSQGEATVFIEFMLESLCSAIEEILRTDQVSDQVYRLLRLLEKQKCNSAHLISELGLTHRPTFRKNYLNPALEAGLIERTIPESPRSPKQQYVLTDKGRRLIT